MSLDILNYFASRNVTVKILEDIQRNAIFKYYYCYKADCKYCQKFKTHKVEFDIKVFLHLIKK